MLGTGSLRGGGCVDIGHGIGNQTGWNRSGIIARASLTSGKEQPEWEDREQKPPGSSKT